MPLSGKEMLKKYKKAGWKVKRKSKNDHVQMFIKIKGKEYNETIPMHKELKKGMESALLKRLRTVK